MTRWRARHRGNPADRGAAAVEFAIVLVVLLLIIFAIIDFGRLIVAVQGAKAASREAARRAVVTTGTGSTVYTAAKDAGGSAASLAGGNLTVTATPGGVLVQGSGVTHAAICPTAGASVLLTVTISPFRWFTPVGIFSSSINQVSQSTTMRCE